MTNGFDFWYRYLLYRVRRAILNGITPATAGTVAGLVVDVARRKSELIVEIAFLRQQVLVLRRIHLVAQPGLFNGKRYRGYRSSKFWSHGLCSQYERSPRLLRVA